jgi:GNAT superfamily N-acetyltransferase
MATPRATVDWCVDWFTRRGMGPAIELRVGEYPEVEEDVAARGFRVVVRRPAMARYPIGGLDTNDPPRVTVRPVRDEADLAAYQAVQAEAFDMSPEVAAAFLPWAAVQTPGLGMFLAAYDDVPCATAGTSVSPYGAGIVGVATLAAYRRRGLGRAVTAAAVRWGERQGADLAWLYPTAMARRLYEGLGFRVLGDVQVWVR